MPLPAILSAPATFEQALADRAVRALLPTSLGSAELARLESVGRRHAVFSARVPYARHLSVLDRIVQMIVAPERGPDGASPRKPGEYMNEARARALLRASLADLGYEPDPSAAGGIRDLASEARIKLQIETNVAMARGYGQAVIANDSDVIDEFPGWRLLPSIARKPRGDAWWRARWRDAGLPGPFDGGDFVALKSDPGWSKLSRFGNPYPPFDFGSTRRVEDVDRDLCERYGLIRADEPARPADILAPSRLQAEMPRPSEALRQRILAAFPGAKFDNGVLVQLA